MFSQFIITLMLVSDCFYLQDEVGTLRPKGTPAKDAITLSHGNLKVTFIDNNQWGVKHKAGYNGIAELYHTNQDSSIFVPFYAGFNLEHIFGGDSLIELFEPRKFPMNLYNLNEQEVLLYQAPTPLSSVESLTHFKIVEPHYIDIIFKCVFHSTEFFRHNYAGLFWASYIDKPKDKSIYFKGISPGISNDSWIKAYSTRHGSKSTHKGIGQGYDFFFAENFNATLASHFSEYHFSKPFYFGNFHNMVFAYLFKSDQIIRFSQSPTGGGETNPAWDFQYLIDSPEVGKIYSFKSRIVYKPFISAEDIEAEYEKWSIQQ